MKSRTLLILGLLSLLPSALFAQSPPDPVEPATAQAPATPKAPRAALAPASPQTAQPPRVTPAPPAPAAPAAPAAAPALAVAPRPMGQMVNVRIDVTLTDTKGAPKVLTMTVADGEMGLNRTTSAITSGVNIGDFSFNADATPVVVGSKIRLRLTADATVPIDADSATPNRSSKLGLRQSQTVILNDGDSVEIARAADPVSDRVFVLSVKVKIQR